MLAVLLMILKIIGIVIASILGLLLFLLILILFVPIRYNIRGQKTQSEEESLSLVVKASYLFHLINARFLYPGDGFRLRVTFFTIIPKKERDRKAHPKKERSKKQRPKKEQPEGETTDPKNADNDSFAKEIHDNNEGVEENTTLNVMSDEVTEEATEEATEEVPKEALEETPDDDTDGKADDATDESLEEKATLKDFINKLKSVFSNLKLTVNKVYDKIIDVRDNTDYYIRLLESNEFKSAFKLAKKELIRLLKAIGPKKIKGNIFFGSDDPSVTGQVLSYYSVLYPKVGKNIYFYPDFEDKHLYGDIYLKGHITVFVLLIIALKLYFNKNLKNVIKKLKKEN